LRGKPPAGRFISSSAGDGIRHAAHVFACAHGSLAPMALSYSNGRMKPGATFPSAGPRFQGAGSP
jgi:hypothetical protein